MAWGWGGGAGAGSGAGVPPPVPGAAGFHIALNGRQTGPFDLSALQGQASSGQLKRDTLVWKTGMAQWVKAGDVPELLALFADVPPSVPPA
jgi:hypothetical protein